jgi:Fic family protein
MSLNDILKGIVQKQQILDQSRPLPSASVKSLVDDFRLRFTHETTAIEGNTLTLRETQAVLEEGITVHGKSLREHLEVINANESLDFLESAIKTNEPVTERLMMRFYEILMKGILSEEAGMYRRIPVYIKGAKHVPPNWIKIPKLMQEFEAWLRDSNDLHPVVLAAKAHIRLARIHPFVDGNGRTCRLLVNYILMQHGYLPALFSSDKRDEYMKALDEVEDGNEDEFIQVTSQAVEWTLDRYLRLLEEI